MHRRKFRFLALVCDAINFHVVLTIRGHGPVYSIGELV